MNTVEASNADDVALLAAYEPIVRFNAGELFFPTAVEDHVACCDLMERVAGQHPRVVVPRGELTLERLAEVGAANPGAGMYLRLVDEPFSHPRTVKWRHRSDRPRFHHASRLARVGVLSRMVDALNRISLLFRGKVAKGTEAAAETLYRERMRTDHHPYYGRVVRAGGYTALQYWIFYPFNDWRSRIYGVNDHEADWEQVVVYLAEQTDGPPVPSWVVFSAHDETGEDLRRRWDDPDLTLVGDHPVVFAGLGSHSGAYVQGEYLTSFDPPAFKGFIRRSRKITRWLLPWSRDNAQAGVGIPYIDYARGDGVAVGPGQDRPWTCVLIDDDTPWVFHYQGLWGNDTADPLGGERGPAGPRYERSGAVRQPWGDIVGWSGLSKVAPNHEAANELIRRRLDLLDDEVTHLATEYEARRTKLRADAASGVAVTPSQEAELHALASDRVKAADERRRLETRLTAPPPEPGPHDHLRHRHLPLPQETNARLRLLSGWSAVSTPLLLGVLGLIFLPDRPAAIYSTVLLWGIIVLGIEAAARRHFARYLLAVVVGLGVALIIGAFAWSVIVWGWRFAVAGTFWVLGIILLVANVQELGRD
ncbi:MAG: hypothetical protein HY828_14420 [Actinobacteria bacterium]|nr:hypothetical protein [Actinomycetota bacterium]